MMNTKHLPGYTIGRAEVYEMMRAVCGGCGDKIVIIGGKIGIAACEDMIRKAGEAQGFQFTGTVYYGGESAEEYMKRLTEMPEVQAADMVFAVGGGKVIDTAKGAADMLDKPVFTFPTIASTCADVSAVSVLYTTDHVNTGVMDLKRPPVHAFINMDIIASAPIKYIWAGMGDTIAKGYEPRFTTRGLAVNYENQVGLQLSPMCAEAVLACGEEAYRDCLAGTVTTAVEEAALHVLVTTGLVSNFLDSPYNGSIGHAVGYGLAEKSKAAEHPLHGAVVSYGVLILLAVDKQEEAFAKTWKFMKAIGLPVSIKEVQVEEADIDFIIDKALHSYDMEIVPYEVSAERMKEAFRYVESYQG